MTRAFTIGVIVASMAFGGAACAERTTPLTPIPSPISEEEFRRLPVPVQPQAGRTYWALYLTVGEPGSPEIERGVELGQSLRLNISPRPVSCDEGAAELFEVPGSHETVALYFTSEQDAREFRNETDVSGLALRQIRAREGC